MLCYVSTRHLRKIHDFHILKRMGAQNTLVTFPFSHSSRYQAEQ